MIADLLKGISEYSQDMVERIGDCSHHECKVDSDSIFWKTIEAKRGWKLQKFAGSNLVRIVDDKGIRKGNGILFAMREKMKRLQSRDFLQPGDVIGVNRGLYEHYAIYAGKNRVIHYAGQEGDFSKAATVHEASYADFKKKDKDCFVLCFSGGKPVKIRNSTNFQLFGEVDYGLSLGGKEVYTPEETLKRAYSRIGESNYHLLGNNCEHFALWCKTGKSESYQVANGVVGGVMTVGVGIGLLNGLWDIA